MRFLFIPVALLDLPVLRQFWQLSPHREATAAAVEQAAQEALALTGRLEAGAVTLAAMAVAVVVPVRVPTDRLTVEHRQATVAMEGQGYRRLLPVLL